MATYVNVDKKLLTRLIEKGPHVENFGKWNGSSMPCLFIQSSHENRSPYGVIYNIVAVVYIDNEFLEFQCCYSYDHDGRDVMIIFSDSDDSADTVSCKRVIPTVVTSWEFQDV